MKTCHSAGYFKQLILCLLLSLTTVFIFSGKVLALTGNKIDSCADCHGNRLTGDVRPIDAAYRNITTGGFVGSHSTHMAPGTSVASCDNCHVQNTTFGHRDGKISFQPNIKNSPSTATYFKAGGVGFVNQTSNQVMTNATCSSVNCHFQTTTPTWGSTPFSYASSSSNNCNACHGNVNFPAPQDRSHPGTGSRHGVYFGTDAASCAKCHADHTLGTDIAKFAHATSAGSRGLVLNGSELKGTSYSLSVTNLAYPTYMTNADANRNGTCSNLYCHSNGTINPSSSTFVQNQAPTWGGTGSCTLCHKGDSADPMATNSHGKHVAGNYSFGCVKCHAATVSDNNTIASTADHVDKKVTVKFNNSTTAVGGTFAGNSFSQRTPGTPMTGAYCANIYCHSQGTSATALQKPYSTVRWGGALPANCTGCHGGDNTTSKQIASVAHPKHIGTYGFACNSCHAQTAGSANNQSINNYGTHVNFAINVDLNANYGGSYSNNGHKPGDAPGTCSTTYCHSNGQVTTPVYKTPTWATGSLACNACHGDAAGSSTLSVNHTAHVNNNTVLGSSYSCDTCHSRTMAVGSSSVLKTYSGVKLHVNKSKDVAFTSLNSGATPYGGTCATLYCHSDGNPVTASRTYTNPSWGGAVIGCDGCHGVGTAGLGYPNRPSAGVGVTGANSHVKHVASSGLTCKECHWNTTQNNTSIVAGGKHLDGKGNVNGEDVKFMVGGNNASGSYDSTAKTCSATYCHGSNSALPWGGTTMCNSCHSATPNDAGWANNAHKIHYNSTALPSTYSNMSGNVSSISSYRFTCSTCHDPRKAKHAGNAVDPVRAAEVYFTYTSAGRNPVYVSGTLAGNDNGFNWSNGSTTACNATYCHSNGQTGIGSANGSAVSWSTSASTGCTACHGNAATASSLSGKHAKHLTDPLGGGSFGCKDCHSKTVSSDTNIIDKSKHINKFRDYSGLKAGKDIASCNTSYCHSNGKGGQGALVTWTGTMTMGCTGCHTNNTLTHPKHLAISSITCDKCHADTAAAGSSTTIKTGSVTHINGSYKTDVKFANISAAWKASYSGTTCSTVYCHSNGKGAYVNVAWGSTLGCTGCHPNLSGAHAKHTGNLLSSVTFYAYTANKSTGDDTTGSYKFGCANCHPITPATHADGNIDVVVSQLTVANGGSSLKAKNDPAAAYVAGTGCDLVYCHSDGRNPMVAAGNGHAPAWNVTFTAAERCGKCHGNSPADATHQAHVNGSIHADNIYNGTSGLLPAGNTGSVSHGISGQATTINCNICHNGTVTSARNAANNACVSCHGGDATPIYGSIANRGNHVNGNVDVFFAYTTIYSKAQLRPASFAGYTSGATGWVRNGDNYKNGAAAYDYSKNRLSSQATYTAGTPGNGSCSNVVCHNMKAGQPAVNWSDSLSCESCHKSL
ncbi:CxxxxCH/CxxCH domain-containing protein [Geotalea sp. SG265]|uniref:CxxxxCH/CxxCH domain c-type cytochrome n=1 Tax=Geotalea sp. SG265 TaxID=2922867 RepID=UPI001FB0237B|nr:CxxxxCH/CxxCH domain-containing protein [Geotalea sp. SG265]